MKALKKEVKNFADMIEEEEKNSYDEDDDQAVDKWELSMSRQRIKFAVNSLIGE